MKNRPSPRPAPFRSPLCAPAAALAAAGLGLAWALPAATTAAGAEAEAEAGLQRAQTIALRAGWNAVYLEVEPADTDPVAVFADLPVDVVARYFPTRTPVEYISDPGEATWKRPGWGVWYAPSREDAFLTNLYAVQGNQPHLVHATEDATWELTGRVERPRFRWRPGSFNLFGCTVNEASPPTFAGFFAGSGGHIGQRIYRLVDDRWRPVEDAASAPLRPGEAYWVYCEERTDYPGPVAVDAPGIGEINLGADMTEVEITLTNTTPDLQEVSLSTATPAGAEPLPLSYVVRNLSTLETSYPPLPATYAPAPLEPGEVRRINLHLRRREMAAGAGAALVKVTTAGGAVTWLPVRAERRQYAGAGR